MSLIRLNSLINLKHLSSLNRLNNVGLQQSRAPAFGRFASSDSKQDSSQQNDQQQNQGNMQQMPSSPFNQQPGGFPQQQWCPCCCQPTACYMPGTPMQASSMAPGGCNPFCAQQQQMPMQMSNQMNAQMNSQQQYPQFPQFMPMQAHCLPQWNPMENTPSYPCAPTMHDSYAMCSTYCPDCRSPCQPNQTCPRCQGKHIMEPVAEEETASAEEKTPRNNMPSGSAYTDLFEKKKPAETKE